MKKQIPINVTGDGCAYAIKASYFKNAAITTLTQGGAHYPCTGVFEIHDDKDSSDKHSGRSL